MVGSLVGRIALAGLAVALAAGSVWAQQLQTVRVAGTVEGFDGHVLAIKSAKFGDVKIDLAERSRCSA